MHARLRRVVVATVTIVAAAVLGPGAQVASALLEPTTPIGSSQDCTGIGGGKCNPSPTVSLNYVVTGAAGVCTFTGTISWGDGTTSPIPTNSIGTVQHTFTGPGLYTVADSGSGRPVDPDSGSNCTWTATSTRYELPAVITAVPNGTPTFGLPNATGQRPITMDGSSSTVTPTDVTLTYEWRLPDNTILTGQRATGLVTCYSVDSTAVVNLTVHAKKGIADKIFRRAVIITIPACPITVSPSFTAVRGTGTSTSSSTTWTFDANGTTVTPKEATVTYDWTFGDGSSGTGVTTSHVYPCGGALEQTVTLRATATASGRSASATTTRTIQVAKCPVIVLPVASRAVNDWQTATLATPVNISVLANDFRGKTWASGRTFNQTLTVSRRPEHGTAVVQGPRVIRPEATATVRYTPAAGFCGIDSFDYVIDPPADVFNNLGSTATVYVRVCGSDLPTYTRGLATQIEAAGKVAGTTPADAAAATAAATALRSAAGLIATDRPQALDLVNQALGQVPRPLFRVALIDLADQLD